MHPDIQPLPRLSSFFHSTVVLSVSVYESLLGRIGGALEDTNVGDAASCPPLQHNPESTQNKNRYCISALNTVLVAGDSAGGAAACFSGEDATCPTGSALRDLDLPTVQQEVATSLLIAGAWLGSMMASRPSDALGRRSVGALPTCGVGVRVVCDIVPVGGFCTQSVCFLRPCVAFLFLTTRLQRQSLQVPPVCASFSMMVLRYTGVCIPSASSGTIRALVVTELAASVFYGLWARVAPADGGSLHLVRIVIAAVSRSRPHQKIR